VTRPDSEFDVGLGYSLEKFFADSPVPRRRALRLSGLRGEVLSFQLIYRSKRTAATGLILTAPRLTLEMSGPSGWRIKARRTGLTPVAHPTYGELPDRRIGHAPGFYPDPLLPDREFDVLPGQTRSIWLTLRIPGNADPGRSRVGLVVKAHGKRVGRLSAEISVIGAALPKQRLRVILWFHNDCLMSHYGFKAWSREHWRVLESFLSNAADHGVNTITTPVFTPPLDTQVGKERPTVQLVGVRVTGPDKYGFDFRRLEKWIDLCRRSGITDFEISHLATQWGAKSAPKIVARVNGRVRRIFGWRDRSGGQRYTRFLLQFLPKLVRCLRGKGVLRRALLHVSDEPQPHHIADYRAVRETLRRGAPELPVLDALSDIEFFREGLVDRPCPSTDHVRPFLARNVEHLWCYYCGGQMRDVSNRFMDFPSARNRILGWQLYKFGFEGFLHWGYNYWYKHLTDTLVDPYTDPHSGRLLAGGDAFVVYPGADGPVDSIRWEVFREGLQDMRALRLLETLAAKRRAANAAIARLVGHGAL